MKRAREEEERKREKKMQKEKKEKEEEELRRKREVEESRKKQLEEKARAEEGILTLELLITIILKYPKKILTQRNISFSPSCRASKGNPAKVCRPKKGRIFAREVKPACGDGNSLGG